MLMNSVTTGRPSLEAFVVQNLRKINENLRKRNAWRKTYTATFQELKSLSDRDLCDLGIARANLQNIAKEAANHKVGAL